MQSAATSAHAVVVRTRPILEFLHRQERVAIVYFLFLALLGLIRPLAMWQRGFLLALPVLLASLWFVESGNTRGWSRVTRHWSSLSLILAGYWALAWFQAAPLTRYEQLWLSWDRMLLHDLRLQAALEATAFGPYLLETAYLLLYAFPPTALGIVYACKGPARANQFLLVLLLGTMSAYALLPLIPVTSPRLAFPGADLPAFTGLPRTINTYLLDRLDIDTSVFPSGHVAVAFSSAFGLLSVLRERRRVWAGAFVTAAMVYLATVYGRYHYAVDGLASMALAFAAWRIAERWCDE